MGLNITKFLRMKPHLPFRFKTIWYTGFHDGQDQYLTYAVQSVTLPKYDIDNAAGYSNFGNVRMYVPIYSPGVRKLEITFEETNHLYVTAFLHKLLEESYSREPYQITIVLQEFDEHMKREKTKGYVCHLSSYEEPSFKRDGSAQQITVNATFLVDTVINPWSSDVIVTGKRQRTYDSQFNQEYDELKIDKENTKFTFGKTDFGVGGTGNTDYDLRPKSKKTKEIQDKEKAAAAAAGTSYLAMAMANGGEGELKGKGFTNRSEITDAEKTKAKKIDEELGKAKGGEALKTFVEELSDKQYWLGHKGKDGNMSGTAGVDCSGAAGAWAERMGYNIDESTAGAKNGGLVKQLLEQGATDLGTNYDTGLKAGDILNKSSTAAGNSGHVVIFLGYDGAGNMLIAESAGRTGEGNDQSAGGRVRTVSIDGMKKAGYRAVGIMDNAKPRT